MKRLSLTARLSLMFMLAVTGVLAAAGYFFSQLSEHHFDELDRHTLHEKLEASRRLLGELDDLQNFERVRPQLQALLGGHSEMRGFIFDERGAQLFPQPGVDEAEPPLLELIGREAGELTLDGHVWRGEAGHVAIGAQRLTLLILLDVTAHKAFFHTFSGWLWSALVLCALLSGLLGWLLGWLLVRSGLRPLREVTQVAASVSAKSLRERIPDESTPAELQQLVQAFNAMLARLEDAFVRLSNFSADIAHELRTPLSNLMTHTEVALTRARTLDQYQDNLHSNLEELQRMSRMIDDMLFLAKADNGLIVPDAKPIALDALCAQLLDYYQLSADERGVRFELVGAGTIQGDLLMLRRALSNLMSNALRYTPDGERIRVAIERGADQVTLEVSNPGASIAPEHLERLFDRFYRGDPARREGSPSNAGLGLAITRSIVQAHRGRIQCSSAQGLTSFVLEFPN
ncbi:MULTISPECIES: heavy metal sensor histidine kinase [Stutzerimonas stutzeri group]|uniref:heavy metal sensor histidine kinase n=1 Tax=Stutzerimonas stutzeri group TaxID=136846 RepID=UPI0013755F78|nr:MULTISPECIES: heavy metal sensor histidine kinase [Stutzerimonas stutzeri group]NCT77788.1 heavy metal sensor histidine kinase [Stutzerimonas stutzeri]MBK3758584.1 heavy metal sensor histidine kinase [Stutzerimonas frequens]MBK3871004.1 heavy metal sensor histidine kinase [Stutzerimonas frequens]MBK3909341.1 heavy metal sensor histidine kinase [Stutzerimonas frequens]MBK3929085.1 heavy metal sensor histidine kinase [Stutzerimonas frequens]